jgi:PPOX class probable F420-dependent enzyme
VPPAPVPPEIDAFLGGAHPAVVASVRPDGGPHSVPTWYDWEDGRALLSMDAGRLRLGFLRRDPRVSLTVLDAADWYHHVSLLGVVDDLYDDEGLRDIDRLSRRYTGRPYRARSRPRVSAWVRVERWHGWRGGEPLVVPGGATG